MSADVILDTAGVAPGDYYLYAANLQYLANFDEDEPTGGMMTKIVVTRRARRKTMKTIKNRHRASGALAIGAAGALVLLAPATRRRPGPRSTASPATTLQLHGQGRRGEHPGRRLHPLLGLPRTTTRRRRGSGGVGLPQYPGPTLILNQGDAVTISLDERAAVRAVHLDGVPGPRRDRRRRQRRDAH